MPKRPRQHQIDELAQRAFRNALPAAWIVNPFSTDYAKDFLVEIVDETRVTGTFFIVQLKGKESLTLRKRAPFVTVAIDYEHLRYYLDDVPLPVFIVAVDVSTGTAFFEFVQKQTPADFQAKGRATYRVHSSNRLADTPRLIAAVHAAWDFMRDKYPGSVVAAAKVRQEQLKKLDPRFDYDVTVRDGKEHIQLSAREPVECTISFLGSKQVREATLAKFFGEGMPARANHDLKIKIEGSPLFEMHGGLLAEISYAPQVPVELRLFAKSEKFGVIELPEFRGNLVGGMQQQRFEGKLEKCPLSCKLRIEPRADGGGRGALTWQWDPKAWTGSRLIILPWLDPMRAFVRATATDDVIMGFKLLTSGTALVEATPHAPTEFRALSELSPYIELLFQARHVCRTLRLDPLLPKLQDQDCDDIEELFSLVTTGQFLQRDTYTLSFSTDPMGDEQIAEFRRGELLVTQQVSDWKYSFLGVQFDFSEVEAHLFGWKRAEALPCTEDGERRIKFKLEGCQRRRIWRRYLTSPSLPQ